MSLAKGIPVVNEIKNTKQLEDFVHKQLEELNVSRVQAGHAVDHLMLPVVHGFAGRRSEQERQDIPSVVVTDLVAELKLLSPENSKKFERLFTVLKEEIAPVLERQERAKAAAIGVLPSFKGYGATVELRAVLNSKFHFGDIADEYEPEIGNVVPVASVVLRMTGGPPERFFFQADEDDLLTLIESLKATLKDMQKLARQVAFAAPK